MTTEEKKEVAVAKPSAAEVDASSAAKPSALKKVPKPDEAALKAACDVHGAKIEKNKKRLEQIKQALAARAEAKKTGGSPAMQKARAKLAELREQFKAELVRVGYGAFLSFWKPGNGALFLLLCAAGVCGSRAGRERERKLRARKGEAFFRRSIAMSIVFVSLFFFERLVSPLSLFPSFSF